MWQKRIAAAQDRLKKLERQMEMRIPLSPVRPPPPPPPPQVVLAVHKEEPLRPPCRQPALTVSSETRRKVERIKELARAQPGASALTIMRAQACFSEGA